MSLEELNTLLNEVLEHEDYIRGYCHQGWDQKQGRRRNNSSDGLLIANY